MPIQRTTWRGTTASRNGGRRRSGVLWVGAVGLIAAAAVAAGGGQVSDQVPSNVVLPDPAVGGDLDCADIGRPVRVGPDDPHHLDADGDGIGCESWPR